MLDIPFNSKFTTESKTSLVSGSGILTLFILFSGRLDIRFFDIALGIIPLAKHDALRIVYSVVCRCFVANIFFLA
jgi:hypothetical protein